MQVHKFMIGAAVALGIINSGAVRADDYPSRVVTLVVAFPPGGGTDIIARMLAQQMSDDLNQKVIVENKPGATGVVAASYVSTAKPDGYTLLLTASNLAIAPALMPDNKFDPQTELTPISLIGSIPYIMLVNPSVPARTPKELVDFVKKNPAGFRWGDGGEGSPDALGIEQFDKTAGINPTVVPYQGSGPAQQGVLSGEVGGILCDPAAALPLIKSGRVNALGVGSTEPSALVPGIPSVASSGFPGFESVSWYGVLGPKGMPPALAAEIQQDLLKALQYKIISDKLSQSGIAATGTLTPQQFATYLGTEVVKYRGLVTPLPAAD